MGSASETSSNTEESHYGNHHLTSTPNHHSQHCSQHSQHQFASSAAIYGRIGQLRGGHSRERPQSVYEKQFGPVQHSLLSSPPLTQPRSQQVSIAKATVVNLVKQSPQKPKVESNSSAVTQQPPPLPPRPSGGGLNTSFNPPSVEKPKPILFMLDCGGKNHNGVFIFSLPLRRKANSANQFNC